MDKEKFSWELKDHYQSGQFAQDSGVKLFYVKKGSGEKVVLLPGLLATSYFYKKTIEILSTHYQVISLDWPGIGFSGTPLQPYSHRYLAGILKEFLEEVVGDEKVHLVCHGYSGPIAFLMLNEYPEKAKSLTIVCSFLNLKRASFILPVALLRIPVLGKVLSYLYNPGSIQFLYSFFGFSKNHSISPEKARDIYYLLFQGSRRKCTQLICRNIDRTIHAQRDMESGIKKMVGFRQILIGAHDPTADPRQTEYMMEVARLSGVQVLHTGHFPMEEDPLEFSNAIVPLLQASVRNKNKPLLGNSKWTSLQQR